eukprot:1752293-Rhodomonas_salina.1
MHIPTRTHGTDPSSGALKPHRTNAQTLTPSRLLQSGDRKMSEAPAIPRGGWRLTVRPAQFAREALTIVKSANQAVPHVKPIVYVAVGQWYLNGHDGRARAWGYVTAESKELEKLSAPRNLFD